MLELDNVTVSIAGISVLRGVTAGVQAGDTVALVGRNGAGKTTLLRTVMGMLPCKSGRVLFAGEDLARRPAHRRAELGMGYAPENRILFPHFTVEENLRFPCEALGMSQSRIDERIADVIDIVPELKPMLPRSAAALSGGQGKMAALGRALMVGTRLVMLDEPFQGLAPVLAAQYAASLQRLTAARPELAVLITESNQDLLRGVQDHALILERGELTKARAEGAVA